MPLFQHDPLRGQWLIRAPRRAQRPVGGANPSPGCPFCPGNEDATPPETTRVSDADGWVLRVFDNLYPAVDDASEPGELAVDQAASGRHEVVVTTRRHDASLADLDDDEVIGVLDLLASRVSEHLDAGRAYVQAFVNHGRAAGASVPHPHAQVIALDVTPPLPAREADVLGAGSCLLCRETERAALLVDDQVVAFAPSWAIADREVVIAPRHHEPDIVGDPSRKNAARLLRDVLRRLRVGARDLAYNVVVHTTGSGLPDFHWHLHVVPRTSTVGGFELGTGVMISQADPGSTADRLGIE